MDQRPIGVFDSGVGGLSVVRELCRLLPGEDIVYFGDVGRVPYGTRSREVIYRYASEDLRFLRDRNVKLIIAACGTASSVIDSALTDRLPTPYTGVIEPTARAAAAATRNKKVGIIGTDATIRSGSFVRALHAIDPAIETVGQGCALLVPLVENGYIDFENKVTRLVLEDYLRPIRESGADTLILGCTHFPLLAPIIGDMLGEGVTLIDSGAATAGYIRELLRQTGLENPRTEGGVQRYYISEHTETFARTAELFLGHGITAEYAVVLVAATAFAAVLIAIVKSDVVKTLLTGLIKKALSGG